jgi:chromosome segregation protein
MRIHKIRLAGFRGIRRALTIPCGPAFTVICGPNGSGKSTICDALEFLLTGTLERFAVETERREHIDDYLWWRGHPAADEHTVEIEFSDPNGQMFSASRTPEKGPDELTTQRLVDTSQCPSDWASQLCLTSILRDDTITKFSTDQSERERSDFTLGSIGLTASMGVEAKIGDVLRVFDDRLKTVSAEYNGQRGHVERSIGDLSQARASAAKASQDQIARLQTAYAQELQQTRGDTASLARLIAERQLQLRRRLDSLHQLRNSKVALEDDRRQVETEAFRTRLLQVANRMQGQRTAIATARDEKGSVQTTVSEQQARSPVVGSLAILREHGQRIGLQDGRCPLCGSPIDEHAFRSHLREIEETVRNSSDTLSEAVSTERQLTERLERLERELAATESEFRKLESAATNLQDRDNALRKMAAQIQVEYREDAITAEIEAVARQLIECSNALSILEAMISVHRLPELEEIVAAATARAEQTEKSLAQLNRARLHVLEARDVAKRVSTEIIAERLAFLKPSLIEFCERLRPHPEWTAVEMLLRGDVRPFVSFLVGENLNPRFVFSSGQRRALGLAFLLSMHLARTWCNLETLVLDDPVQHIDDYRALHLVETLASMRMVDRQIICTVEDPALADLLCRRLRGAAESDGVRIDLEYTPQIGVSAKPPCAVRPLTKTALAAD